MPGCLRGQSATGRRRAGTRCSTSSSRDCSGDVGAEKFAGQAGRASPPRKHLFPRPKKARPLLGGGIPKCRENKTLFNFHPPAAGEKNRGASPPLVGKI